MMKLLLFIMLSKVFNVIIATKRVKINSQLI